jgi:cysteinyl-tRNA synthetase
MATEKSPVLFYDTMKADKIEFVPREPNKMYMYVCGLTPSGYPHVGHARTAIIFDIIRRIFERNGFDVTYISNFTDIDDKIIAKANEEGVSPKEIADKYSKAYLDAMKELNIKELKLWAKVTENIPEIIDMVQTLIQKGYAYESAGDVYYRVKHFKAYGKLSKRSIREMLVGARIEPGEKKEDNLDFALWKNAKPGEPSWDSPWGKGRPGWHIECSAMSLKYLQNSFDIHGGAQDLVFPHHENEIAQAEAYTGIVPFSHYWIHAGWVTMNREKMSKSVGNVFKIADALKLISPNVLRFFFISTLYSSPLEYAPNLLFQANRGFERIVLTMKRLFDFVETAEGEPIDKSMKDKFEKYNFSFDDSLRDNFNTPEAISVIMMACKEANKAIDDNKVNFATANYMHSKISEWLSVLGFKDVENTRLSVINLDLKSEIETLLTSHKISFESSEEIDSLVNKLIACREEARKNKQYALGDMIRKELSDLDILLEDQASKTIYRIVSGGTNDC